MSGSVWRRSRSGRAVFFAVAVALVAFQARACRKSTSAVES